MDAAHYQQGAMEHFRLSQDLQPETTPDVAQALTASVAGGTHSRAGHRHSIVSSDIKGMWQCKRAKFTKNGLSLCPYCLVLSLGTVLYLALI